MGLIIYTCMLFFLIRPRTLFKVNFSYEVGKYNHYLLVTPFIFICHNFLLTIKLYLEFILYVKCTNIIIIY